MSITLYHNPNCSKSRETLALIEQAGYTPHIIDYLTNPPDAGTLARLLTRANASVRDWLRSDNDHFAHIGAQMSDDEIFALIQAYPALLNRPIVETAKGVALCRPPELVLSLL